MPQTVSRDKPIVLGQARSAHGRTLVLSPAGELDLAFAPALGAAPEQAYVPRAARGARPAQRDADSTIMLVLDGASHLLGGGGRRLLIANAHALPMRVLQLTGSTMVLDVSAPRGLPEKDLVALLDDG